MGWGHNYIVQRYKKNEDDTWDTTYISVKDFYEKSEQQIAELTELLPFPDLISGVIVEYIVPVQYNSIYLLKETEWRSDITRTVTGLSKCFMYPNYTYIMLLTLKASLSPYCDSLYYTLIKGKWELRTDQENFRDWVDPIQAYIDALGPWRPGDDPPTSVKSTKKYQGWVAYSFNKTDADEPEHPNAVRQYMMNQEKSHYDKIDSDHILFEVEEIKTIEAALPSDEEYKKCDNDEDKRALEKQMMSQTFDKLRKLEWKQAKTKSGKNKIIDWNCKSLDLVNEHGGIQSRCGGGCFGPRSPNWCENPVYSVRRKLWRTCILGSNSGKSYWETDQDVNDPHEIVMDDDIIDVD